MICKQTTQQIFTHKQTKWLCIKSFSVCQPALVCFALLVHLKLGVFSGTHGSCEQRLPTMLLRPLFLCQEIPHILVQQTGAGHWSAPPEALWTHDHGEVMGSNFRCQELSAFLVSRLKSAICCLTRLLRSQRMKTRNGSTLWVWLWFTDTRVAHKGTSTVRVHRLLVCTSAHFPHESLQVYVSSHQTFSPFHPSSCPPILWHQHWKVEVGAACECRVHAHLPAPACL